MKPLKEIGRNFSDTQMADLVENSEMLSELSESDCNLFSKGIIYTPEERRELVREVWNIATKYAWPLGAFQEPLKQQRLEDFIKEQGL